MTASGPDGGDLDTLSYEQLVERLESIVSRMAAGDIGIEEVADLYEEAGRLHAAAADRLEQVRRRVEGLVGASERESQGRAGPDAG
jgi:exodeoxyribonuclease VII small subunit